jgi:hypothetical protein
MFTESAKQVYSKVIQVYFNGYSMDELSQMIGGISTKTIHYIIHDWKRGFSAGNIEDARFFMQPLRK